MRLLFGNIWKYLDSKFGIPEDDRHKSLPMRLIGDEDTDVYCWEDWHAEMKIKYPYRYWVFHDLRRWASVAYRRYVEDPIYWLKSKFILREHLIDLRGAPIGTYELEYRGGYLSYSDVIELGTYKAFKRFVDHLYKGTDNLDVIIAKLERKVWKASVFDKPHYDKAIKFYKKIKRIDYFFEVELRQSYHESLSFFEDAGKLSKEKHKKLYEEQRKFDERTEQKVTRYLCEIIKLRKEMQNYI